MNIWNCDPVKAAPLQLSETRLSVQVSLMNSDPLHQHLHTYKRLKNTAYSESCSQFHSCRLNAEWKKDKRQERAIMQHSDKRKKKKSEVYPKRFFRFHHSGGFDSHRSTRSAEQQPGPQPAALTSAIGAIHSP